MHGDVRAVAAVGGGQGHVVALGGADLQGERHPRAVAVDGAANLVEDLRQSLQRHGVLHLGEAHAARGNEDLVGLVDVSAGGHRLGGEGVELPGQLRHGLRGFAHRQQTGVVDDLVGDEVARPAQQARVVGGFHVLDARQPGVFLHQRHVGAREPVELHVVDRGDAFREGAAHLVEVLGVLVGGQAEGGHAIHGQLGDHAEGAHAQSREAEQLAGHTRGAFVGVDFLAVGADDAETADHAGETGEAQAGAVGARGHRAGQRLRVDVALVGQRQSARAQNARHVAQAGARAQRHGAGIGVRADETGHLVQLHPVAVGDGDRGEGMAGAKGTHGASRRRGVPDDAADFLGVRRLMHGARHARLGAGPVAPPLFVHE